MFARATLRSNALFRSFTRSSACSMHVASRPSDLVGQTPLLDLTKLLKAHGIDNGSTLYGKMESLGPCSSVKDRLGRSLIDQAEKDGLLVPGESVLVEPPAATRALLWPLSLANEAIAAS